MSAVVDGWSAGHSSEGTCVPVCKNGIKVFASLNIWLLSKNKNKTKRWEVHKNIVHTLPVKVREGVDVLDRNLDAILTRNFILLIN